MNLALIGYGKMGHAVETAAIERQHTIVATIDNEEDWQQQADALRKADVALEFSTPNTAVQSIRRLLGMGLPVVSGTTGWYDQLDKVAEECRQLGGRLLVASNFSIGMNVVFDINRRLARLMNGHSEYSASITETHHIYKLDAPSGTAIRLAEDIVGAMDRLEGWECFNGQTSTDGKSSILPVRSIRQGEVPGIHEITYDSPYDTLTLRHSAKGRQGLALGAVLAAEWLVRQTAPSPTGYYTMQEVIAS